MNTYIYPNLPAVKNLGIIRFRGSGLANCLFVASRAFILSKQTNFKLISPTWKNLALGPYLRREKDKRHYFFMFNAFGIHGFSKIAKLILLPKITLNEALEYKEGVVYIEGIDGYFNDLIDEQPLVKLYIYSIIRRKILEKINKIDFTNTIGIHVRLGDYIENRRTDLSWYLSIIEQIKKELGAKIRFFLFSDGKDDELRQLISIQNLEKVFFGSAIGDIVALSKCKLIIGSDSTFSAWGAYLGNAPIIFPKRHFGPVLKESNKELVLGIDSKIPVDFLNII